MVKKLLVLAAAAAGAFAIWRKVSCGKLKSGEDIAEGEDAKI